MGIIKRIVITIATLIALVFLITACGQKGPVCMKPYIIFNVGCCLDQNDNRVCDNDEIEKISLPSEPSKVPLEEPGNNVVIKESEKTSKIEEHLDITQAKACKSDLSYTAIKQAKLDVKDFKFTDDGFTFKVYPLTEDGQIVPAEISVKDRKSVV